MHIAINNCLTNVAMAANIDVREQNASIHFAVGIYAHIRREDTVSNCAAGNNAAGRNNGIERRPRPPRFSENEFGRRILALMGTNRPVFVIQIEHRGHRDDVHVRFVVRLESSHIAPVQRFFLVLINEVVSVDAVVGGHSRQDIFAEIVA